MFRVILDLIFMIGSVVCGFWLMDLGAIHLKEPYFLNLFFRGMIFYNIISEVTNFKRKYIW